MSDYNYTAFFKAATGHEPFDYQRRLAEDPECKSRLIEIPTGWEKPPRSSSHGSGIG